ncbi:ATP-grasp domain-containing protein [Streptacidiphilus rugosus]|uniref:ATP-grasp domain-containing protein n=1 Tax=Streptacidiphilus rugosus TaxID=405783 RepID=UPI000B119A16|nr:ATP-grasp domain-containing protein [Streptacidiphilus rugosus]
MTANHRILMVQPYRQLVEKAAAAGFQVWSIWDPTLQSEAYLADVAAHSADLLHVDFEDEAALRALVRETALAHDVAHILHLGQEATMLAVVEEAEALGLAVNPVRAVRFLNDKALTRQLLAERGLSPVRTAVAATAGEVPALMEAFGYPAVVKPTRLAGSAAVRLVHGPEDLGAWRGEIDDFGYQGPVVLEEYLEGPEFSVETLSAGGVHQVVGITAKRVTDGPLFVETGQLFPAPLPADTARDVRELVVALLDAAGHRFGPAHTEIILTAAGPRVVESQARLGGDRIPQLIRIATGFDIEAAIFEALAGRDVVPAPAVRSAAISFFQLEPGPITAVGGLDAIGRLGHVHDLNFPYGPGDRLPVTVHSGSRHGFVIVDGSDAEQTEQRAAAAKALLRLTRPDAPAVGRGSAAAMDPAKTLLVLGHLTEPLRIAKSLGLHVILIQHKDRFEPEQAQLADVTFVADFTDWTVVEPLVRAAHQRWPFAAALSLTEPGLEIAGRVNDMFGLGGTSWSAANLLRDKLAMRRHLAVTAPQFAIGAEPLVDRHSMAAFGRAHGYPFVVKPVDLTAGFGIFKVQGPEQLDEVWQRIGAARQTGVDRGSTLYRLDDYLMEEYIPGPEFSVESFSFGGRHVLVAITEKLVDETHFAELGHALPARLEPEQERGVEQAVAAFLDAMGVQDGPGHTELRLSPRGPLIIEGHNRNGGGRIQSLVEAAYGIDLVRYALAWPFGLVDALEQRPTARAAACARGVIGREGTVREVEGVTELRAHPDVIALDLAARPGTVVPATRDNWDRLGMLAVTAADTDKAVLLCEELLATRLTIRMEGEEQS